ncbi:MAG: sulfotransferase [Verrucomicrobiae bacterium]|nr:sulfotransferase [Verrucomicrobiae bacterium]
MKFGPVRRDPRTFQGAADIIPGLGSDLPGLQQARALWQANRFDEALELFEQTARRHPQNLVALIDGSRALGARFEIRRAGVLLERLLKLGKSRPEILHLVGQSYRMIFRPELAEQCFEAVLKRTRKIPDTFLELAVLQERRHELAGARELVEECLRLVPGYAEARLMHARLIRRLGDEDTALRAFRELAMQESAHPAVRSLAWTEAAQCLDRREAYDEAMQALLAAKELMRPLEGPVLREATFVVEHLGRLADSLTADDFQRWSAAAREFPQHRTAVLTSFPRSGTTLLEQVLDSHSGVISSDEREAFARDIFPAMWLGPESPVPTVAALDAVPAARLRALRSRYLDYMEAALAEPIGGRIHLDKNPPLTLVLPGYLRLFPETKTVFALRDPRDVVISCFMQALPLNPNSVCFLTLERACQRYAGDLRVWHRLRDLIPSPWIEIRYEDTVTNLPHEARRALAFLGLPWEEGVLGYRERIRTRAVGSPSYEAVRQPLYTRAIGRWRHYERFLKPWLPILEPAVKAHGY